VQTRRILRGLSVLRSTTTKDEFAGHRFGEAGIILNTLERAA
jgi:hypothetical protein